MVVSPREEKKERRTTGDRGHSIEMRRHVASRGYKRQQVITRGVALLQDTMATSLSVEHPDDHSSTIRVVSSSLRERVNLRQIFGIAMLIVVDLIWVGSAGLTRYLFHHESYDKPLFTVYFKTGLFTIYLLPFFFWRPWQRLCCFDPLSCCYRKKCKRKRSQREDEGESEDNQMGDDDVFEESNSMMDEREQQQLSSTSSSIQRDVINSVDSNLSSEDSISSSGAYRLPILLGPSSYKPLQQECSDDNELPHPLTLSEPSVTSTEQHFLTTSTNNHIKRKRRLSRVRFSQTVEVKHVPSVSSIDEIHTCSYNNNNNHNSSQMTPLLTVRQVVILSLPFGLLWFFANYLYARALDTQSVGTVNTLSSLSGVFVLIMAAIPLPRASLKDRDKFTLTKLAIITISVGGAVLVGLSPTSNDKSDTGLSFNLGAVYAVGGAILYACYLVLLSKAVPDEDSLEIPMFFGFVGVVVTISLSPLIVLWNYMKWEEFELPLTNMTWTLLLINGFVGTVLSELLWLWGSLLTSSLVGTLSLSLVTPLSITYSIVIGEAPISVFFVCGAFLTVIAFVMIAIINHWSGWDPLWLLIKKSAALLAKNYRSRVYFTELSVESQSLLTERDNNNTVTSEFIPNIQ